MTEEKINESGEVVEDNANYIAAIKELKENSVSRDKYDKLKSENKQLVDALVNGQSVEVAAEPKKSIEELREAWRKEDQTNLEYVKNTLALRSALIEAGYEDPFLPHGQKIYPTQEDIVEAEKVVKVFEECIEYADGDSEVFTNELMRRTNNVKIFKK